MAQNQFKNAVSSGLTLMAGDAQGRVRLPVLSGPARGLRFDLDLKTEAAYFLGKYDRKIVNRLARLLQRGWTIWDCGTYLGFYTALFARLVGPGGQVVAIEPDPQNMARTRENVAQNGLTNVEFLQAAVGASTEELDFIASDNTHSHLPGTFVGASRQAYSGVETKAVMIRVRGITLDSAVEEERLPLPHLIKLDIEGAEALALPRAHTIARVARPLFALELHNPECDSAAWEFAQSAGYQLQDLATGTVIHVRREVGGTLLASPIE